MELDQLIFAKAWKFYQRYTTREDPAVGLRTVNLDDIKPRLTIIARTLTGDAIEIQTAEREGGWKGNRFLLPACYQKADSTEGNFNYFLFRTSYLSIQKKLNLNWGHGKEFPTDLSRNKAMETSGEVLALLFKEFPSLASIYEELKIAEFTWAEKHEKPVDLSWIYGKWMSDELVSSDMVITDFSTGGTEKEENEITTEIKAKPSDQVKTIEVNKKAMDDYCLTHNFEKVETADEFDGVWRQTDGEDTLNEDKEALDELNLKVTIRVDDPTHSVYQAEFGGNITYRESREAESEEISYPYDEWNYRKGNYKKDYCKVIHRKLKDQCPEFFKHALTANKLTLVKLERMLALLQNKLEMVGRKKDGEELDIDTFTDALADIRAGSDPDENLYFSKRKRSKDMAVVVLIDSSLSTDSYTGNQKILNIEKTSVLLLGEAMSRLETEFRIDTFNSRTRNHCNYITIKDFKDPWHTARNRIGKISPEGYTRIGPALRHAGTLLKNMPQKNKWIIMLSDGKPNDYDQYEGRYGIEDVKKALRELSVENIHTYALAVESQARYYLPQMFGHNCYNILPDSSLLPQALTRFIRKAMYI